MGQGPQSPPLFESRFESRTSLLLLQPTRHDATTHSLGYQDTARPNQPCRPRATHRRLTRAIRAVALQRPAPAQAVARAPRRSDSASPRPATTATRFAPSAMASARARAASHIRSPAHSIGRVAAMGGRSGGPRRRYLAATRGPVPLVQPCLRSRLCEPA